MQNKTIVKFLVAVIALVCLYELSFTYISKNVEKEIREEVGDDYEAYIQALSDKDNEEVWLGYTYREVKQREINLGLDLRGGISVTLEISMEELIRSMAAANANSAEFKAVETRAQELFKTNSGSYIEHFYSAFKELQGKQPLANWFITRDNDFTAETKDSEVLKVLNNYAEDAMNQANQVLRERVKQFGIAQPDIRKLGNTGRIMVDLPGVKDVNRVRKLLQGSANLQFWDVFDIRDIKDEILVAADLYDEMFNKSSNDEDIKDTAVVSDELLNNDNLNPFREAALAGYSYNTFVMINDTAKVNKFMQSIAGKRVFPDRLKLAYDAKATAGERGSFIQLYFLSTNRQNEPMMQGDLIKFARADFDENGRKIVSLDFKSDRIKQWEDITRSSAENQKPIAIVLDGVVYSAPVANGPINSGSTMITGGSREDNEHWNKDLANVLNAGKFPAPAKIVEESLVGPTLGQEAIQSGVLSFVIALLVVLLYMVFYYSSSGWVANVALIANIFFIIGALAAAPTISLTLPGVAGIVLTVGMSVDANVLIYERIREELNFGKSVKQAISDGFKNSYTAILDANITTLITGIILWYFGSGVIESFAQTLVIGILTSLFSAIFITRLIFDKLLEKNKEIKFTTKFSEKLFKDTKIEFIQSRRKYYLLSGAVILISLASIFTNGFDLGTDFTGGRTYKVNLAESTSEEAVRLNLSKVFVDNSGSSLNTEVKAIKGGNQMIITTKYMFDDNTKDASTLVEQKLFEGLKEFLPADMSLANFVEQTEDKEIGLMQSYLVGPTIADDIIEGAITSIIIALVGIFLYITFRFRRLNLAIGASLALMHDVIIVLGVFSLFKNIMPFSMEINQAFIAAILTVVGYSINDTVVIFDRIRELITGNKDMKGTINRALNNTLTRTFNTSITIFIVLLAILLFGGESIQGFAFALIVGVVVGTYSSLFIASPVYYDLQLKKEKKKGSEEIENAVEA